MYAVSGYEISFAGFNHAVDIFLVVLVARERNLCLIVRNGVNVLEIVRLAVYGVLVVAHELLDNVLLNLNGVFRIDPELDVLRKTQEAAEVGHKAAERFDFHIFLASPSHGGGCLFAACPTLICCYFSISIIVFCSFYELKKDLTIENENSRGFRANLFF